VAAAHTRPAANPDLARQAQALIRSLAGVASAHVLAGPAGIDSIHIIAEDHDSAENLPRNVRSALLAGLATSVRPARITVRVTDLPGATPDHDETATPRLVADAPAAADPQPHDDDRADDRDAEHPPEYATERPRLVAVDVDRRPDGEVACRVAIAFQARLHHGAATATGGDATGPLAAARAALQALDRAGITGLDLEGVRQIDIGDRDYVVVAISRTDDARRFRSGSAPAFHSPERGAAEATIVAAHDLI
jgi:hypothetical protein